MDKNQFKDLLNAITEAYNPHDDPRNAFFPMDQLKPWQRLIGGDIHDIPGGKEAWEKQQAEKAKSDAARSQTKPKLTAPTTGDIYSHIETNAFGLPPEAHEKAKEMVGSLKNAGTYDYPNILHRIHGHLEHHGVDPTHPHMQSLANQAYDAEQMNYEKSRARAGL